MFNVLETCKIDNLPMEKHNLDVHVLTILVQKVLQEMRHRLVRYVTANDDVSVGVVVVDEIQLGGSIT